jgi:protocatechuate 3,4-dioxygenase beta subunit
MFDKTGLYDYHETGPERRAYKEELNTAGKAANFDFRGKALANEQGNYEVETVVPSPYLDDEYEDPPGTVTSLFIHSCSPALLFYSSSYSFLTSTGIWRCPHIHYYVTSPGYTPLVTQLYLKGHTVTPGGYVDKHAEKAGGKLEREMVPVQKTTSFGEVSYNEVVFDIVITSPK